MSQNHPHSDRPAQRDQSVLILSHDAIAAALLGGLVETLGYRVQFARPPESVDDTFRRVRPRICLADCTDPATCNGEFFGRAMMRGISVVIFGDPEALERVRALARAHNIDTLLMPPQLNLLEAALQRAGAG
jgi:DNA-binding NtrC family response regulator